MIRHIVLFKVNEKDPGVATEMARLMLSMKDHVPMIREIEVGRDFLGSARSCDVALSVLLDDRAALEAYQQDSYHCSVVKTFVHSHDVSSVSADYEI